MAQVPDRVIIVVGGGNQTGQIQRRVGEETASEDKGL